MTDLVSPQHALNDLMPEHQNSTKGISEMQIRSDLIKELHRVARLSAVLFKDTATALVGEDYHEKNAALPVVREHFTKLQKQYSAAIWKAEDEAAASIARDQETAAIAHRSEPIRKALEQAASMTPDEMSSVAARLLEEIQECDQSDEARFYFERSVERAAAETLETWERQAGLGDKVEEASANHDAQPSPKLGDCHSMTSRVSRASNLCTACGTSYGATTAPLRVLVMAHPELCIVRDAALDIIRKRGEKSVVERAAVSSIELHDSGAEDLETAKEADLVIVLLPESEGTKCDVLTQCLGLRIPALIFRAYGPNSAGGVITLVEQPEEADLPNNQLTHFQAVDSADFQVEFRLAYHRQACRARGRRLAAISKLLVGPHGFRVDLWGANLGLVR